MPKVSKILYNLIKEVPRVEMEAYAHPITRSLLKIELTIIKKFNWNS